jgi:hypothetical protein
MAGAPRNARKTHPGTNDSHRALGQGVGRRETVYSAGLYAVSPRTTGKCYAGRAVLLRRVQRDHAWLRIAFD